MREAIYVSVCHSGCLPGTWQVTNGKEAGSLQVRVLNIFRGPRYVFGHVLAISHAVSLYAVRPIFRPPRPPVAVRATAVALRSASGSLISTTDLAPCASFMTAHPGLAWIDRAVSIVDSEGSVITVIRHCPIRTDFGISGRQRSGGLFRHFGGAYAAGRFPHFGAALRNTLVRARVRLIQ